MSTSVVFSIPSKPGDEFISKTRGPLEDCSMSIPQTPNFIALAALNAMFSSSSVRFIFTEDPPLCKFYLKSPSLLCRFIADAILPLTTITRRSVPFDSLIYSCNKNLTPAVFRVSIVDSALK